VGQRTARKRHDRSEPHVEYWLKPCAGQAPVSVRTVHPLHYGDRSRWVGPVDRERLDQVLDGKSDPEDLQAFYQGDGAASSPEETDLFTQRPKLAA
jgi:hypothetical protein